MESKLIRKPIGTANLAALSDEQTLSDVRAILGYKVADNASQLLKLAGIFVVSYPDPFMVLHTCGKRLYTDVWNEPKFEGRRTK
jgi:hypothetical protein